MKFDFVEIKFFKQNDEEKVKLLFFEVLRDMYENFPQELQEWIKINVLNNYGSWNNAWGVPYLDNISDAFIKWRYSYENNWSKSAVMQIETGFLTVYRNALREACCQLFFNKSWEQYKN